MAFQVRGEPTPALSGGEGLHEKIGLPATVFLLCIYFAELVRECFLAVLLRKLLISCCVKLQSYRLVDELLTFCLV